jgi:hypothetical protein
MLRFSVFILGDVCLMLRYYDFKLKFILEAFLDDDAVMMFRGSNESFIGLLLVGL